MSELDSKYLSKRAIERLLSITLFFEAIASVFQFGGFSFHYSNVENKCKCYIIRSFKIYFLSCKILGENRDFLVIVSVEILGNPQSKKRF